MAKDLDLSEFGGTPQLDLKEFETEAPEPASKLRRVADAGLALGRGSIRVPEAAVGLSNIVTGGRTGKAVERLGVRFKDAKQVLTDYRSDEQKAADAEVQQAEGFLPTVGAMVQNPSTIVNAVAESAPSMLAGGALSQGMVAKGVGGITAGAVGEGVISAGQGAEQVRQETKTGFLTPAQAALAAGSGAVTGVINRAAGKLADKLGIADVNTAMATGKLGGATEKGVARRIAEGAVNEGVLQELPQSAQEQAAQNLALDKPIGEGVAQAAASGMLVGGLTGGGFGAVSGGPQNTAATQETPRLGAVAQTTPQTGVTTSAPMGGIAPATAPEITPAAPPAPPVQTRVQAMGIDPAAGPLQAAAGVTVDTGADVITQQQEVEKQAAEAKAKEKAKPGQDGKKPEPEAPAPVQPAQPNPAAVITGPFTKAIHGAANATPTPAPAVNPQGAAATQGAGAAVDAAAAPGVGADQGPMGAPAIPAAIPEPANGPQGPLTQESTNANQDTQPRPQGTSGDSIQRPADAIDPGANAEGPQRAVDQPAAPASTVAAPESKPPAPTAPLDLGAHTAATSPHNDRPEPTPAQKEAGNYKKAHLVINGVGVSVENPQGSVRSGTDADGKQWSNTMQWHYGYAKGTTGSDDEQQDVFVKPGTPLDFAGQVFVIDQVDPKTGKHDEYKSMVGGQSPMEARKAYHDHYAKDWKGFKRITALTWDQWREWLKAPKGTAPAATLMDRMVANAGGDVTFGDIAKAEKQQEGAASNQGDAYPERWAVSGWASAEYEDRQRFLGAAGIKADSQAFKDAIDKSWKDLTPMQRASLAQAINGDKPAWMKSEGTKAPAATGPSPDGTPATRDRQGLTEQDRYRAKVDSAAQDLASQIYGDFEEDAFDADEVAPGLKTFSQDAGVPADELRQAVLKNLRASDMSKSRLRKVEKALDPTRVPKPPAKPTGGNNLRTAAYERNPFMTFLAKHGLFHDKDKPRSQKAEFSPDKQVMVMGYGPVFRKTGLMPDLLVVRAIEDGYLPQDGAEPQVVDLIRRAIGGERIAPLYAEGAVETEMQRRMDAVDDLRELDDNEAADLDPDMFGESNTSTEDAMRALGFSEQEIQDAIAQKSEAPVEGSQGGGEPDEAQAAGPGEGDQGRPGAPPAGAEQEGLSAPTREDVLTQQERSDNAQALDERAQIDREASAQTLTAQTAPEQRKDTSGDMFAVEKAQATIDKRNASGTKAEGPSLFDEPAEPETQAPKFRYALVNRPADMGTIPRGLDYTLEPRPAKGEPHHDMARHGILVTDRALTDAELKSFELAPLVDGDAVADLAAKVAADMQDYASQYLDMKRNEPDFFKDKVLEDARKVRDGVRYSIGDEKAFVTAVGDKLSASVPVSSASPTATKAPTVSANTIFTEDAAAAARARLKAKLGRLNSGLDPETMLDGITLAGYHIEKGARTFAAYTKAMLEDLGEAAKPYLKSWYAAVYFDPKAYAMQSSMTPLDKLDDAPPAPVTAPATPADGVTRAAAGGQEGINGEWYEGGQILPTSKDTVKGEQTRPSGPRNDAPAMVDTTVDVTPAATLAGSGLVVEQKTSNKGKTYWSVSGDTLTHKDMLDALGFGKPFRMGAKWYRSVFDSDPTERLALALQGNMPTPAAAATELPSLPADEAASVLRQNKIEVIAPKGDGQVTDGVWTVAGKGTFDAKDTIKKVGGRWNGQVKAWSFTADPTGTLAYALKERGSAGATPDDAGAGESDVEIERRRELRQREDARNDERADAGNAAELVALETRSLILRGEAFGIPRVVLDEQIEDIGLMVNAHAKGKPLFLLANEAGTGKTMVLGGAIRELRSRGEKKFVYVTMNTDLIAQIQKDLRDYGVDDVSFHTYSELSGNGFDTDGAVLIFDEAHNIKNVGAETARANKAQDLIAQAKMTIMASATLFENPVEARYLASTGIFDTVGGFPEWAKMYGASVKVRKFYNPNTGRQQTEEIIYWAGRGKKEDGAAARAWLFKQAIMTQRAMKIEPGMVDVQFRRNAVDAQWVELYDRVQDVYDAAIEAWTDENGMPRDAKIVAEIARHRENTVKRVLEAAKLPFAIADAKELLAAGRNVVIFVETKADRTLGKWRRSENFKDETLYSYEQMQEMMAEWKMEADMARMQNERAPQRPFAEFIYTLAGYFDADGLVEELPSTADQIVAALGADKVGIYTGAVSNAAAGKNKTDFLAGRKKVLVATMAKGGTGLSLHDIVGNRPTTQLNINLPWKATGVDQVAARVARYGLRSKAEVRWLFASNIPWESQKLAPRVGARMRDMGAIVKGIEVKAAEILDGNFDFEGDLDVKGGSTIGQQDEGDIYAKATRMEKLRRKADDTSGGFFETPFPLAALMTKVSGVRPGHSMLEPSAGKGNLLRLLPDGVKITAVEQREDNHAVVSKRHPDATVQRGDFMEFEGGSYDTVLMNPPFERLAGVGAQDVAHVQRAYGMLKDGGRMAAIMGEGAFFRESKQDQAFREWLDEVGAIVIQMPEGAFKQSGTGVRTRMVVIDKGGEAGRTDLNLQDMDPASLKAVEALVPSRYAVALAESKMSSEQGEEGPGDQPPVEPEQQQAAEVIQQAETMPAPKPVEPTISQPEESDAQETAEAARIADFGEKIGGARKDTAKPTGKRMPREADERPAWARKYHAMPMSGTVVSLSSMMSGQKQEASPGDRWQLTMGDGPMQTLVTRTVFPSEQAALDFAPIAEVGRKHRTYPYKEGDATLWGIYRKMGERKRTLVKGGFATENDAMTALVTDPVSIIEHKFDFPERPWLDQVERIGPQRRTGNVTPEMFQETFGFRGGEFGKWNQGGDGQEVLNHAYDGLLDMADVLGVPPRSLSLNGELAIAFGSRGTGGKGFKEAGAAHYETDYEVMNLTKMQGAGSLAHEWFHALDHYLARLAGVASSDFTTNERGDRVRVVEKKRSDNLLSNFQLSAMKKARPELVAAFRGLIDAMRGKPKQVPINIEHAAKNLERYKVGLDYKLKSLRQYLTDPTYNRGKEVATPDQLVKWDALEEKIRAGDLGAKQYIGTNGPIDPSSPAFNGTRISAARESRMTIVDMNAIFKAVTGRSFNKTGYDSDGYRLQQDAEAVALQKNSLESATERAARGELNTVTETSDYVQNARDIDSGRVSPYWSTIHEMGARAFESYITDRLADIAGRSDYLVYGAENRFYAAYGMKPYPEGDDRARINTAFAKLFDTLEVKEDDSGKFALREPDATYDTDLFGQPVSAPASRTGAARSAGTGVRRNAQPATGVRDTATPRGEYFATTLVGSEVSRELGAARITKPEHAAQATQYLYKSAVERLDAIVTDAAGKPLAIVGGFKGALNQASIYPATLMAEAVRIPGAAHIWFSHNHPSGNSLLSRSDEMLNQTLTDVFSGSGIEPMGLLAIGDGKYSHVGPKYKTVSTAQQIPTNLPSTATRIKVPVIERTLAPGGTRGDTVDSPQVAKQLAKAMYAKAKEPGLMLLDGQLSVVAWVPIPVEMMGELRGTGQLNAIYRAISHANAGSAIIVHGGELSYQSIPKTFKRYTPSENIAAALSKVDVNPLDSIDVTTGKSVAESGQPVKNGPMFSRKWQGQPFYSALSKELAAVNAKAQPALGWAQSINGLVKAGKVKQNEVEWSGIIDWLKLQGGKVTREQVAAYLDANGVRVEETVLGSGMNEPKNPLEEYQARVEAMTNEELAAHYEDEMGDSVINQYGPEWNPSSVRYELVEGARGALPEPDDGDGTRYGQSDYQLPGGTNYRELLLTLPEPDRLEAAKKAGFTATDYTGIRWVIRNTDGVGVGRGVGATAEAALRDWANVAKGLAGGRTYKSGHWDQPNVLAHIRLNDRTDADGKRVLFVEEIQSDWGQAGKKKGFSSPASKAADSTRILEIGRLLKPIEEAIQRNANAYVTRNMSRAVFDAEATRLHASAADMRRERDALQDRHRNNEYNEGAPPAAPFVTKTDAWVSLALKRIVKMAVDEGYDKVAFVNGEQSAKRYDLSKQVKAISWINDTMAGGRIVTIKPHGGADIDLRLADDGTVGGKNFAGGAGGDFAGKQLADVIGKDLAEKVMATNSGKLTGIDLKVGGEGMRAFYDKIVPVVAKDVVRKLGGGALEQVDIGQTKGEGKDAHSFGAFKPEDAAIVERAPGVFQVWVKNERGVKQVRGGNFDTRALAERYIADMAPGQTQLGFTITPAMRERASNGLPLFERKAAGATGLPAQKVRLMAAPIASRLHIDLRVVDTPADLPIKAPADAVGLYNNGTIWLVAGNIKTRQDIMQAVAHEAVAHLGLRQLLEASEYRQLMAMINVGAAAGGRLAKVREEIRNTYIDKDGKFNLNQVQEADEIAARVAELGVDADGKFRPGFEWLKAIFARVAQWLRAKGLDVPFTNTELQGMLVRAQEYLERGPEAAVGDPGSAFSRTGDQTKRPIPAKFQNLKWEPSTDDMLTAEVGNGWAAAIYMDADGSAELTVMDPLGVDFGRPMSYADVNEARTAAPAVLAARIAENGMQAGDPTNSDIRFMRSATLRSATEALKTAVQPLGTVNLWDRTVGTQYHKATKDRDFKRVFDGFVQQTDDTAHYAIEAESMAPSILMRIDTVKDALKAVFKSGKQQDADLQVVSKALFANIEGEEGVKSTRYDDDSLRIIFNATPRQIEMYRQARAAIDTSIERLAQTYAAQMGETEGMDLGQVKGMDLADTVASVKQFIQDKHDELRAEEAMRKEIAAEDSDPAMDETRALEAEFGPKPAKAPSKAATQRLLERLDAMEEQTRSLQEAGYMPAMRFGKFAVTVRDPDADEVLHFEMFETRWEANLAAAKLQREYPRAEVTKGVMNPEQYAMFRGVSPETVELFAKFTGADQTEAYQDYIALAKSARSVMKRQLKRKGIAGFSQDATRVMAAFVTSNARQAAINMNIGEITDALASKELARKGDVQREAQKLSEYMSNPLEEARRLRGFMFMHFMGGSVASALVNLTQPIIQTGPYLHQFAGSKTAGIMVRSAKMAATGGIDDPELARAAKRAHEDGITEPHEIHQLMADAGTSAFGNNLRWRAGVKLWSSMFSQSESFNRRITFLAAYQVAKETSKPDPYDFARRAVIETQGLYSKTNRPNWARGAVGATIFTFKQFSIAYLEWFWRLPNKQKAIAMAILILAAGTEGIPFVDDLEDLIDTIRQSLGYNTNSKKAKRKFLEETFGQTLGEILNTGVFSQSTVDLSGRLGMGNLLPATAVFKPSETDKSKTIGELAGPIAGILQQFQRALAKAQKGDITGRSGALTEMAPTAVRNVMQGSDMMATGIYKDTRGYKVADVDAWESFAKMLGLQPSSIALQTRKFSDELQDKGMTTMMETMIADRWAAGVVDKDPAAVASAREALKTWNERNPESRIVIKPAQIFTRVKKMRETRDERFIKTVPRENRALAARELQ